MNVRIAKNVNILENLMYLFLKYCFYFVCVRVCVHVHMCTTGVYRDLERDLEPLELEHQLL